MNKIKRVSCLFKWLFQIGLIALPICVVVAWVIAPEPLFMYNGAGIDFIPRAYPILHPLSEMTKIFGCLISMIPNGIVMLVLYNLIRLFKLYEKGEIFSLSNVRLLRNIGYTVLIGQLLNPIYDALISLNLTWNNPHGQRFASVTFDGSNVGLIMTGVLVILISWIMIEACKLREEQQLTI